MPFALKLRRNPAAPRLSLRERYAALKSSAAKVMGKPARFAPPKPIGAGEPSEALAALINAHQLAYGRYLIARSYWAPDLDARRQAEEEAFRALLHSPLRSDADRVAYLNQQGVDIDVEGPMILDLISRSPLATATQVGCVGFDPARLSAMQVDLSALDFLELVLMHEAYQAARHVWEGVQSRPFSIKSSDPRGFVFPTAAGELAGFEEDRTGRIVDRIVDEMASRTPRNEKERDQSLLLRLRHELDCEDRIRRDDLMREITQAWGA